MNHNSKPTQLENYLVWSAKVIAGLLILGVLGIHFAVNHLIALGGLLTYQDILNYYQHPIVPVMEIFFLVFVVFHALLGLRSILLDITFTRKYGRVTDLLLAGLFIFIVGYGSWLVIKVVKLGSG